MMITDHKRSYQTFLFYSFLILSFSSFGNFASTELLEGSDANREPLVTQQDRSSSKLRVFILAGQSNMQGQGEIDDPQNDPGDLIDIIGKDIDGVWSEVGTPNNWNTLDNVYLYYEGDHRTIKDKVTVGQGTNPNTFGPELMFAYELDRFYDDPILIIKTAWGGKSLAKDFRPPSAGGTIGAYYQKMIQIVKNVTQNLNAEFPNIGTTTYEISGFAWFQGWNDGDGNTNYFNEYESNLGHLVNDVRNDLGVPDLPFVIAGCGQGGTAYNHDPWVQRMQNIIFASQKTVACNDDLYGGKLGFIDTKRFFRNVSVSPMDAMFHYNNNAETFLNIGKSMGYEMVRCINDNAFCTYECGQDLITPRTGSIGNRVWNDLNRNGWMESDEPGIPGVFVVLWGDPDGDGIPDRYRGFERTDTDGYYNFTNLAPGNYIVFVWSTYNWGSGKPLDGFVSTNNFVADANNDVDRDNNGSGEPYTDIKSGIITLTMDGESLYDGDDSDCVFDVNAAGNNTVDFGFYDPNYDCTANITTSYLVSIGNRVWNDLNRNGINEPDEPGIPEVFLVLWSDSNYDGVPESYSGFTRTDANGNYKFSNLIPGNYLVFVWNLYNWESGQPLHGFVSTNNFVADANNDVDFDNNGSGPSFTDIKSGIVYLTSDGEPLNDGDPFDCIVNYDAAGNNTVDFGFYDPDFDCTYNITTPSVGSIGNRVWHDLNRNGIHEPNEPGIAGVSLALWSDPDRDGIPDIYSGSDVTDADGYYRFSNLIPGNYIVFVWSTYNWGVGEPLNGFVSTNNFIADVNNDADFDNNGTGNPFTDIKSGIITLTNNQEPLNDGDPFDCVYNYDAAGNNTVDFGFYNTNRSVQNLKPEFHKSITDAIQFFPNPVLDELTIKGHSKPYRIKIFDSLGRVYRTINLTNGTEAIDVSTLQQGMYFIGLLDEINNLSKVYTIIKL